MACKLITLNGAEKESEFFNELQNHISLEESEAVFDSSLTDEFVDWYGEDWVNEGIEPTATDLGVQNIKGDILDFGNVINKDYDINDNFMEEVTYTDEEGNLCAAKGLTNTVQGTGWKIVKDFKGMPKHSQGGVDISISNGKFSIHRGNSTIKAENGLLIPNF